MRFVSITASLALLAPLAFAEGAREAVSQMRHADGGFLSSATGNVNIRDGSDFQRFTVQVFPAADHVTLTAQINDTGDHFADLGALAWGDHGMSFNVTTQGDGHLPLGVAHVSDLAGRHVRVLDGEGHVILVGETPQFAETPHPDPKPEPTPTPTPSPDISARAVMVRPDGSPYDDSRGVIAVVHRAASEAIRVEVGHLAPQTHYEVFLGDDGGGAQIADFTTNGEGGGSIGRDTAQGGELPGGATLADLAGRHVEVRHGGDVVLFGAVPRVEDEHDVEPVRERERHEDEDSGCVARVVVEIRPHEGHERFELDMDHLPRERHDGIREGDDEHHGDGDGGATEGGDDPATGDAAGDDRPAGEPRRAKRRARAEVYLADESGAFQPIGSSKINGRGRARLRYTTRRGGSLPLGAATLRELAGRGFEVRVNGTTVVSGTLPNF